MSLWFTATFILVGAMRLRAIRAAIPCHGLWLIAAVSCAPTPVARVHGWQQFAEAGASPCRVVKRPGEVTIYDCTGLEDGARALELVRQATLGLGFPPAEGPREGDSMFVGRHYLAWIDNTGYSGKMNGLWPLHRDGDQLEFTLTEPVLGGVRPISMLLPGEDGDGRWPRAYNGAEHYEIPRFKNGRHDSQAGIREANHFTDAPSWWRECINSDTESSRWDVPVGQTEISLQEGRVTVRNEAPLTIVARFYPDSFPCGSSYPVDDKATTDLHLVTSYTLDGDSPQIERRYQMVNAGDHAVANQGIEKLIGGQLLTDWPRPHYLKQYQNFLGWDGLSLKPYAPLEYTGDGQKGDLINIHGAGSLQLSASSELRGGRAIGMTQLVQNAGEDFGVCLCMVHGGFEFTGSVLAGQSIAARTEKGASQGPEQLRVISVAANSFTSSLSAIKSVVLQAEDVEEACHERGFREGAGWKVQSESAEQRPGFLFFKRYVPMAQNEIGQAAFYLAVDAAGDANQPVAEIDIVANGKRVIASKLLKRSDFYASGETQRFVLDFKVQENGNVEPRVRWLGGTTLSLDAVVLNSVEVGQ